MTDTIENQLRAAVAAYRPSLTWEWNSEDGRLTALAGEVAWSIDGSGTLERHCDSHPQKTYVSMSREGRSEICAAMYALDAAAAAFERAVTAVSQPPAPGM